ncbi:hypothetical protein BaRGS_00011229 [Batillaria attramentaria]|uniref:Grh/CP2 DB domain-containing protein n=1 Tax=Batillaria attramentaria TaxID=370345 RepID=A0ABD0LEY3_9CAEN
MATTEEYSNYNPTDSRWRNPQISSADISLLSDENNSNNTLPSIPAATTAITSVAVSTDHRTTSASVATPTSSANYVFTIGTDRERKVSGSKSGSSAFGEHAVKGGKTAKRGKTSNSKFRPFLLSFADIENGLSQCFNQSASSWSDALHDLTTERAAQRVVVPHADAAIIVEVVVNINTISYSKQTFGDRWRSKAMIRTPDSGHHESNYNWDEETGGGAGKRTKISHPSASAMTSWDIDGGLAADFDGSLSGLGTELGTSSYNMSEALLALPVFKQENLENGFQYILGAATSPAVKMNEETLTYLNQGQSYEIKVKKLGDLSDFQGKCLRSVVKVQFHERRLQYMEREQMEQWKQARPGERILDVDIPLSYGLIDVNLDSVKINQVEFVWDPTKETGLYFRVHAISTEFTAKKHGGEKGVPFRIQIETYSHNDGEGKLLHAASCQIKVFKPKGADRKHKTDREKMEKRSDAEKEKYQPSYACTVLTEVPLDQVVLSQSSFSMKSSSSLTTSFSALSCGGASPIAPSPTPPSASTPNPSRQLSDSSPQSPQQQQQQIPLAVGCSSSCETKSFSGPLSAEATAPEVQSWLQYHRFSNYTRVFQHFSGADLLRLNRDDLIQICGLVDGIRLNNALQSKSVRPRLTIYICQEPESVYHAVYIDCVGVDELKCKLASLFGIQSQQIGDIYMLGPSSIHIMVTDEVLQNTQDQARFIVEGMREESGDKYRILLKSVE